MSDAAESSARLEASIRGWVAKVGRCRRCIATTVVCTVASWVIVAVVLSFALDAGWVVVAAVALSVVLSTWLLAHALIYWSSPTSSAQASSAAPSTNSLRLGGCGCAHRGGAPEGLRQRG